MSVFTAAILDDPMECSRGERLTITLAKNRINRSPERVGKAKVEVDIFELLRDSEYETAETSTYISGGLGCVQFLGRGMQIPLASALYVVSEHCSIYLSIVFYLALCISQ